MNVFNAIAEPWSKIVALAVTIALGVLCYFLIEPRFGIGVACGAIVYMAVHWAARLDERPFWQHVFGRSAVYQESKRGGDVEPSAPADRPRD